MTIRYLVVLIPGLHKPLDKRLKNYKEKSRYAFQHNGFWLIDHMGSY